MLIKVTFLLRISDTDNPTFGMLDENNMTFKINAQKANCWEYLFLNMLALNQ